MMSIIVEVARELLGMFLGDARLATAIVVLVAIVAGLVVVLRIEPLVSGSVLLLGCVAILVEAALREARRQNAS
jgi:uncharacterized membrane protein